MLFPREDPDLSFDLIEQGIPLVNPALQPAFNAFLKVKNKVLNTLELPYSNAKLEIPNNLIKAIRQNTFGSRDLKKRILITLNIKKERTNFVLSGC